MKNKNLIGISGKILAGKDTVGKIIQDLTTPERLPDENGLISKGILLSPYEIKKYGYKLKLIASILLGIPVEDFEKREVKDRILGEEWATKHHNWIAASELEIYAKKANKTLEEYVTANPNLEYLGYNGTRALYRSTVLDKKLTVREFLQRLGTEAIRNNLHPNTWENALFADYLDTSNWIITDVRFSNEIKALNKRNGITIRVNRLQEYDLVMYENKLATLVHIHNNDAGIIEIDGETTSVHLMELTPVNKDEHPSETSLDNAKFDYTIRNFSSMKNLIQEVKKILIKEKII